jgi:hypothetical protein
MSFDPTAGERARALSEREAVQAVLRERTARRRLHDRPLTDPTAGERGRANHERPGEPLPITDPTDPHYGETLL